MAETTGPVILAGAIAAANESLFAPIADKGKVDTTAVFRLIPATAGLALALALLERAAAGFAKGLAWLLVFGVFIFPVGKAPSVLTNVNKILNL